MRTHVIESTHGGVTPTRKIISAESNASKRRTPRLPSFGSLFVLLQDLIGPSVRENEETDGALLRCVQAGDRGALAKLYARYAVPLRTVAVRLVREPAQAEDLLHDVFCEAWKCAASYDPARSSVRTWLLIRLRSRAIDRLRSSCTRRGVETRVSRHVLMDTASEDTAETSYLSLVVSRRMNRLPMAQRRLLDLVFYRDLPLGDVATELGCPLGTVKSQLHRLLHRLAEKPARRRTRPSPASRHAA